MFFCFQLIKQSAFIFNIETCTTIANYINQHTSFWENNRYLFYPYFPDLFTFILCFQSFSIVDNYENASDAPFDTCVLFIYITWCNLISNYIFF
jgi:hypothetical protein